MQALGHIVVLLLKRQVSFRAEGLPPTQGIYILFLVSLLLPAGLNVSVSSSSSVSLTISWTIVENVTVTSYTIYYSNTNFNCFNDSYNISGIPGSETMYTLTGLEENTDYNLTVKASLPGGGIEVHSIEGTTLSAGQFLK